ncbi:hypothetical protein AB0L97_37250, partial [Nocardia sp. NPDC051911]
PRTQRSQQQKAHDATQKQANNLEDAFQARHTSSMRTTTILPANQSVTGHHQYGHLQYRITMNIGELLDNRRNLAFSTGPAHARPYGLLLAQEVIDQLLNTFPELV